MQDLGDSIGDELTVFHSATPVQVDIGYYIGYIASALGTCPNELAVAFIFLARVAECGLQLTPWTVHRAIIASVVLSIKMCRDISCKMALFAAAGGISVPEMSRLECALLRKVNYKLSVDVTAHAQIVNMFFLPDQPPEASITLKKQRLQDLSQQSDANVVSCLPGDCKCGLYSAQKMVVHATAGSQSREIRKLQAIARVEREETAPGGEPTAGSNAAQEASHE